MEPRIATEAEKAAFQKVILPVIATGKDGSFRPVGTCWIFAANGRDALAFSATHVFEEIVRSEQRHDRAVASMPGILRDQNSPPGVACSDETKSVVPI